MVVEHVLSGQPPRDEGVRHEELPRLLPHLRLVAPEPEELGTDGLRGEHGTATSKKDLLPVTLAQLFDLPLRPRVYAVEDRGPQGITRFVGRQQTRPDSTRANRGYCVVGLRQEFFTDSDEVRPPHLFGVVLGPAGTG